MNFYIISIFPEIFDWFISTSLIWKAVKSKKIKIKIINPRDFCNDKKKQIDDEIYWWWDWLLLKAKPIIDSVDYILSKVKWKFKIIYMCPSENMLDQNKCFEYSKIKNIIIVCWRYEWIDYRFEQYFMEKYPDDFQRLSIWKYVLMWWEVWSMVMIESISRLAKWVINNSWSYQNESYNVDKNLDNIEYPQFTRPQSVCWYDVPEVFLGGNHKQIKKWRDDFEKNLS